jgi:hypothetical protein
MAYCHHSNRRRLVSPATIKPAPPNYAEALVAFAEQLYGSEWQAALSRALGVHPNTTYRVARAVRAGRDYATAQQLLGALRAHLLDIAQEIEPWARGPR